jgi:hypothetical protein
MESTFMHCSTRKLCRVDRGPAIRAVPGDIVSGDPRLDGARYLISLIRSTGEELTGRPREHILRVAVFT